MKHVAQDMAGQAAKPWVLGGVCGRVALGVDVRERAENVARQHFANAEAADFCGEAVDVVWDVSELPQLASWMPLQELFALGFEPNVSEDSQVLATVGVDRHVDNAHGFVFGCVLFNDGLRFKQGRASHQTAVGEWFVFDDRLPHEVKETKASTTYLCLVVPLRRIKEVS